MAAAASLLNGVFGLLVAWALIRCRFPGQRFLDSLIDLPFALPTAVAGLALSLPYRPEGWRGGPPSHLVPFVSHSPSADVTEVTI